MAQKSSRRRRRSRRSATRFGWSSSTRATRSGRRATAGPRSPSSTPGPVDAVLLDIKMAGHGRPRDARPHRRARPAAPPVLMISGHGDIATAVECTRRGAADFLEKPLQRERVLVSVRERPLGQPAAGRERAAAAARRRGDGPRRRQRADEAAPGGGRARRADRGDGSDPRRERHGQGARGPRDPRRPRRSPRGPSSRSTARRSPRS